jgi:hypothetical protein
MDDIIVASVEFFVKSEVNLGCAAGWPAGGVKI